MLLAQAGGFPVNLKERFAMFSSTALIDSLIQVNNTYSCPAVKLKYFTLACLASTDFVICSTELEID